MYLTYKQTLEMISGGKKHKNKKYHLSRISSLVKNGELQRATPPELFVKNPEGEFGSLGEIKTENLVCLKSVQDYIKKRTQQIERHGVLTKGGRPVKAVFSDGTESKFKTLMRAQKFFGITRYMILKSINENRPIDFPVSVKRAETLGVEHEPNLTEHVKFRYCD